MFSNQVGTLVSRISALSGGVRDRLTRQAFVNVGREIQRTFGESFSNLIHRGLLHLIPKPGGVGLIVGGKAIIPKIYIDRSTRTEINDWTNLSGSPNIHIAGQLRLEGVLDEDLVRDDYATMSIVSPVDYTDTGLNVEVYGRYIQDGYKLIGTTRISAFYNGVIWVADVADKCQVLV